MTKTKSEKKEKKERKAPVRRYTITKEIMRREIDGVTHEIPIYYCKIDGEDHTEPRNKTGLNAIREWARKKFPRITRPSGARLRNRLGAACAAFDRALGACMYDKQFAVMDDAARDAVAEIAETARRWALDYPPPPPRARRKAK